MFGSKYGSGIVMQDDLSKKTRSCLLQSASPQILLSTVSWISSQQCDSVNGQRLPIDAHHIFLPPVTLILLLPKPCFSQRKLGTKHIFVTDIWRKLPFSYILQSSKTSAVANYCCCFPYPVFLIFCTNRCTTFFAWFNIRQRIRCWWRHDSPCFFDARLCRVVVECLCSSGAMLTMVGLGAASVPQFSVCCGGWTACESRAQPRTEEKSCTATRRGGGKV